VLWLYHVEGYQHAEIAEVFGATVSFSKSQLARALAQLRHFMEPKSCLMIETR
jgi:DNA-directed RNA polymerase specialized sigma24 family protein